MNFSSGSLICSGVRYGLGLMAGGSLSALGLGDREAHRGRSGGPSRQAIWWALISSLL